MRSIKQFFIIIADGITSYLILWVFYHISESAATKRRNAKRLTNGQDEDE
jgi:hypothetical protein